MSIHQFKVTSIDGDVIDLQDLKGKVVLIVNTASKCGFTGQYEGLQALYEKYSDKGLEIIGFPCDQFAGQEPGSNEEVKGFCSLNYGVTFPLSEKVEVRGENAHPLFKYLTEKAPFKGLEHLPGSEGLVNFLKANFPKFLDADSIKWNFTKFLINKDGEVVGRFESPVAPVALEGKIEELL